MLPQCVIDHITKELIHCYIVNCVAHIGLLWPGLEKYNVWYALFSDCNGLRHTLECLNEDTDMTCSGINMVCCRNGFFCTEALLPLHA